MNNDLCDCCRRGPRNWRIVAPKDLILHCLYICDDCLMRGIDAVRTAVDLRIASSYLKPVTFP
jgi:hypothetical protein